ncbi:Uncharacterised protein [Sphingobacterium multivorum]|jgi:hypothetical protein|uniref:Uncharacterized protein n=1 Tax=Sphingobacterium multivorum TaxID=28454 RepID=A0A2X2JEJ7_SPHMU|nr:hypothetical protein [Sphingobacterium multivorum]SPZ92747.1 Uncharacterised protein [Sphingobacterium multivorum]
MVLCVFFGKIYCFIKVVLYFILFITNIVVSI